MMHPASGHLAAGASAILDCVIIGGGPAGLTAAIHLARLRRRVVGIEAGAGRAALFPRTWNHPGYPARSCWTGCASRCVPLLRERVVRLDRLPRGGVEVLARTLHSARHVIPATGSADRLPPLADAKAAILAGQVRACPVRDAYEPPGKPVAVVGTDAHAASEALFLAHYSRQVTLLTPGAPPCLSAGGAGLTNAGVGIDDVPDVRWDLSGHGVTLHRPRRPPLQVEAVWPGQGATAQAALATRLGLVLAPDGRIPTDDHQETSVADLFAAGYRTTGLNQIGTAIGPVQIAATRMHSILRIAQGQVPEAPVPQAASPHEGEG